jgi:hypothetical protein
MTDALKPAVTVLSDRVSVTSVSAVSPETIDALAWTAAFGGDAELRGTARWIIRSLAAAAGIRPASIHDLYMAMGRREAGGFTVPAINVRAMAYETARAVIRSAKVLDAGAFIFEIARSEIGYTEQRPHEYAAIVIAAALREGFTAPIFIQGDHVQTNAKKYNSPDRDKELDTLRALIKEEIAAGFYNIDIDTSTLVDLDFPTRDEQQRENYTYTAHFTKYIRARQPQGIEISIGGEIGEVGKYNTQPDEVRAYVDGVKRELGDPGMAKISVQTGTSHGGVPNADGTLAKAEIDFDVLRETTRICREEYGIAGSVQHGASTLSEDVFNQFPENDAVEIHLATGFQNMILDAETLPQEMKDEIRTFCFENCADERKSSETDEQFVYKTRKKAIGPFKRRMWELPAESKGPIIDAIEKKFEFLMDKLGVYGTRDLALQYVPATGSELPEYAAASEELTAAATVDPNEGE